MHPLSNEHRYVLLGLHVCDHNYRVIYVYNGYIIHNYHNEPHLLHVRDQYRRRVYDEIIYVAAVALSALFVMCITPEMIIEYGFGSLCKALEHVVN